MSGLKSKAARCSGAAGSALVSAASAGGAVSPAPGKFTTLPSAPVRAFASRALRMRGFTVLEAESAEAALQILQDETLQIDIFVTDVVMPGMDGPTWVRIALQKRPQVRVIFVSGYAEESLSEGQSRIPNSTFLAKPFSLSDLTETVHAQCK